MDGQIIVRTYTCGLNLDGLDFFLNPVFVIFQSFLARVLEEEWGRREALEKLQEEQRIMLEEERRKREEFEKEQSEKEGQLRGNYFQSLAI